MRVWRVAHGHVVRMAATRCRRGARAVVRRLLAHGHIVHTLLLAGALDKNRDDVGTGVVGAPACGDVVKFQVRLAAAGAVRRACAARAGRKLWCCTVTVLTLLALLVGTLLSGVGGGLRGELRIGVGSRVDLMSCVYRRSKSRATRSRM